MICKFAVIEKDLRIKTVAVAEDRLMRFSSEEKIVELVEAVDVRKCGSFIKESEIETVIEEGEDIWSRIQSTP